MQVHPACLYNKKEVHILEMCVNLEVISPFLLTEKIIDSNVYLGMLENYFFLCVT
jgi:hypothetical protein